MRRLCEDAWVAVGNAVVTDEEGSSVFAGTIRVSFGMGSGVWAPVGCAPHQGQAFSLDYS